MIFSLIGLGFDLLGVLLLFKYGILPKKIWDSILQDNSLSEKDEKKYKVFSKVSIILIVIGFCFQIVGTIYQNNNGKVENLLENKKLGNDCNTTVNVCGELKIKYDDNKMYYIVSIKGDEKKLDSISKFTIELQDIDGFKLYEVNNTNDNNNVNRTYNRVKDIVFCIIYKGSTDLSKKSYSGIKKWDLLCTK